MDSQGSVTVPRDLYDIGREHREVLLRWVAQTGLAVSGMFGLLYGPGVALGWHTHLIDGSRPLTHGQVPVFIACGLVVLTWALFTFYYALATQIAAAMLAGCALMAAGVWVFASGQPYPAPVVAVLGLISLLGFLTAVFLSAHSYARTDPRDLALPRVSLVVALPFYGLAFALGFTGLYSALAAGQSLLNGNPLSAIHYAIAVAAFSLVATMRSRAIAAHIALAAAIVCALCLPLALAGLVLVQATAPAQACFVVLEIVLLTVFIPVLLCLAHRRGIAAPKQTTGPPLTCTGTP